MELAAVCSELRSFRRGIQESYKTQHPKVKTHGMTSAAGNNSRWEMREKEVSRLRWQTWNAALLLGPSFHITPVEKSRPRISLLEFAWYCKIQEAKMGPPPFHFQAAQHVSGPNSSPFSTSLSASVYFLFSLGSEWSRSCWPLVSRLVMESKMVDFCSMI